MADQLDIYGGSARLNTGPDPETNRCEVLALFTAPPTMKGQTAMSTDTVATTRELRPDLHVPVTRRECGHVHEGPRFNDAPAALRYARHVLNTCVCGVCRGR